MIVTITKVEKVVGDYGEYVKVTGVDGNGKETFKNVSSKFTDKWELLKEHATIDFKMVKKDNKWAIADIIPIGEQIHAAEPPPPPEAPKPEGSETQRASWGPPKTIPGQQIGMTVKEVGDMIRSKSLVSTFGLDAANELLTWYRGQIIGTTGIVFDGEKFPKYKGEK